MDRVTAYQLKIAIAKIKEALDLLQKEQERLQEEYDEAYLTDINTEL